MTEWSSGLNWDLVAWSSFGDSKRTTKATVRNVNSVVNLAIHEPGHGPVTLDKGVCGYDLVRINTFAKVSPAPLVLLNAPLIHTVYYSGCSVIVGKVVLIGLLHGTHQEVSVVGLAYILILDLPSCSNI